MSCFRRSLGSSAWADKPSSKPQAVCFPEPSNLSNNALLCSRTLLRQVLSNVRAIPRSRCKTGSPAPPNVSKKHRLEPRTSSAHSEKPRQNDLHTRSDDNVRRSIASNALARPFGSALIFDTCEQRKQYGAQVAQAHHTHQSFEILSMAASTRSGKNPTRQQP